MSKTTPLVIGLILGLIAGGAVTYFLYAEEINEYHQIMSKLDNSENELSSLSSYIVALEDDYEDLEYNSARTQSELQSLHRDYQELEDDFNHAETNWYSLSECVYDLIQEQMSYTITNKSFSRIFAESEIEKIADTVEIVSRNEEDRWDAYYYIHKYVRDEIQYVHDAEIPTIHTWRYFGEKDNPHYQKFETSTRRNLLQDLSYTIEYKQGDCDDQAILEFAMIQYYRQYIQGSSYSLYLTRVEWENGDSHLAVIMPVTEGRICILDSAGSYNTGNYYSLQSKLAKPELNNWEDYWESENGDITEITLWEVDIDNGDSWEVFKGSLEEAIMFFSD